MAKSHLGFRPFGKEKESYRYLTTWTKL